MTKSTLAIVEISFSSAISHKTETQEIEDLLRRAENVSNLVVQNDRIVFYLWSEGEIDFGLLDEIKVELKRRKFSGFIISASEYVKAAGTYFYKD